MLKKNRRPVVYFSALQADETIAHKARLRLFLTRGAGTRNPAKKKNAAPDRGGPLKNVTKLKNNLNLEFRTFQSAGKLFKDKKK